MDTLKGNTGPGLREQIKRAPTRADAQARLKQARNAGIYPARYIKRCERALERRVA